MSKRVSFKNVNTTTINTMQEAIDAIFAYNFEYKALAKAKKSATNTFEAIEAPTDEQKADYVKTINIIDSKRSNLRTWYKSKMTEDVTGYYTALGVLDMVNPWIDGLSYQSNVSNVKDVFMRVYGFNASAETRVANMAKSVAMSFMGQEASRTAGVLKGNFIKDRSASKLYEVCLFAIIEYANKSGGVDIQIKTAEFYEASFTYAKDSLAVEGYKINEKKAEA